MEAFVRIPIASFVFFGIFFAVSVWHIVLCVVRQSGFARKATKSFSVLSLAVAVAIAVPIHPLLYIGLLCGAVGDFLLIFKRKPVLFILGAIFFLTNHILFIVQGLIVLQPFSSGQAIGMIIYIILASALAYFIAFRFLKKPKRSIPGGVYVLALLSNIALYTFACFTGRWQYFLVCLFGAISFMVSDLMLAYSLFVKGNQKSRHLVMASYLIAQFLISFGFVLTFLA